MSKKISIKLVPYEEMRRDMDAVFNELKKGSIVLIDAKISPEEESEIIAKTMENIDLRFKGIEISTIDVKKEEKKGKGSKIFLTLEKIKKALTGKERGITIIGPASLIKKMEKTPEEIYLYM